MYQEARIEIGDVVAGRYRIEAWLGQGNMATVFRARHLVTGRACALKVIHARLVGDPELAALFVREAQVAGRVGASPYIADVLDAGVDPERGTPFLVMELLEGEPLSAYLNAHAPLERSFALRLLEQLAEAMDQAHEAGVVHRDLKPANLFLTRSRKGEPVLKVLDFGIAKILERGASHTATQIGSPLYAAPEQLGAAMREMAARQGITISVGVSPSTDVWPLGLIACELLTGVNAQVYWTGGPKPVLADLLIQVAVGEAPLPSGRAGPRAVLLPAGFDAWFLRCLRKNAAERWPSIGAAVRELATLFSRDTAAPAPPATHAAELLPQQQDPGRTVPLAPAWQTPVPRVPHSPSPLLSGSQPALGATQPTVPRKGHKALGALAGATLVLALLGGVAMLVLLNRPVGPESEAPTAPTERAAAEPAPASSPPSLAQPAASPPTLAPVPPAQESPPQEPPAEQAPAPSTATPLPNSVPTTDRAAATTGTLNMNSIPVSKVVLDGRPLGNTPRVGVSVTPGEHTVLFISQDYGRKTISVTVKAGETKTAAVRFTGTPPVRNPGF